MGDEPKPSDGSRTKTLLVTAGVVATTMVILAAFTDLELVLHRALLGLAVAAFWPFMIVAAGVAALLIVATIVAVIGMVTGDVITPPADAEAGQTLIEAGFAFAGPYYEFLAGIRHPVFWGVPVGILAGCLLLGAYLAAVIYPPEWASVSAMSDGQAYIEQHYDEQGSFPEPNEDGHLVLADDGVLTDGFDQPIRYEVEGAWRVATWRLRAAGSDGEFGTANDFCAEGGTELADAVQRAGELLERFTDVEVSRQKQLEGIVEMRCDG